MTWLPVGTRLWETQRLTWPSCEKRGGAVWVTLARPGAAAASSLALRPSSFGRRSAPNCVSQGDPVRTVAGSWRIPGNDSMASLLNGGSALLRWRSDGRARSSVGASSRIVADRLVDSDASACVVVLKVVIRPLSEPSVD